MDKNNFIMSFTVDKNFESDQFLKLRLRVCHDGESPNNTFFTKETMEESNKTLEYIPLLAHVYIDESTGKPVLGAHDMHIEEDKLNDGETRVIYDEIPIGVVPSLADNNCTIEEYEGLNYTFVDCYLWRDYANYAEQLVEDAENVKLSMEIDFSDAALSYDAANDRYNISLYRYRGITLLNDSFGTGMKKALATTKNFSADEDVKSKMIVLMEELQKCLRDYDNTNSNQKGVEKDMENEVVETVTEEVTVDETTSELEMETSEATEEVVADAEVVSEDSIVTETEAGTVDEEFSEPVNEDLVCTFRISHDDTRFGLQSLLNAMCDESHFYSVLAVYDKYFYYCDYFSGEAFKQSYKIRKDVVSFNGDPEPVFTEFVTQAERDELENMRSNYAALVQFKADAEAAQLQAQKDAVFAKPEFANIVETKSFKKLVEDAKNYSVEECEQRANAILEDFNDFALTFAANDEGKKKPNVIGFAVNKEDSAEKKPYGNLFD